MWQVEVLPILAGGGGGGGANLKQQQQKILVLSLIFFFHHRNSGTEYVFGNITIYKGTYSANDLKVQKVCYNKIYFRCEYLFKVEDSRVSDFKHVKWSIDKINGT